MPDIRLIASDMDGTLLDAQGRISPRTLSALRKAQEKGVIFTMCTGRFHTHCCALARDMGLNCSIIASNGGSVFDGISQRMVGGTSAGCCLSSHGAGDFRALSDSVSHHHARRIYGSA